MIKFKKYLTKTFNSFINVKNKPISFLDDKKIPYDIFEKNNHCLIKINTSIFPKYIHSMNKYDNIYSVVICNPILIPETIYIIYGIKTKYIIKVLVDGIHLNSEKVDNEAKMNYFYFKNILSKVENLHDVCFNDNLFSILFDEANYDKIFPKIFYRLKVWNYLDRQYNFDPGDLQKTNLANYFNEKMTQQKRQSWIKNTLEIRRQQYINYLHSDDETSFYCI